MLDAIQLYNSTFIAEIRSISTSNPEFTIKYPDRFHSNGISVSYFKVRVRIEQWIHSANQYKTFEQQLPNLPSEEIDLFIRTESENPDIWKGPNVGEKFIFVFSESLDPFGVSRNICVGRLHASEKNAVIRGISESIRQRLAYYRKWIDWNRPEPK